MIHNFKQGDRALFVYEEDLLEGIVQEAHEGEVIIQFSGISHPSSVEADHLQLIQSEI